MNNGRKSYTFALNLKIRYNYGYGKWKEGKPRVAFNCFANAFWFKQESDSFKRLDYYEEMQKFYNHLIITVKVKNNYLNWYMESPPKVESYL